MTSSRKLIKFTKIKVFQLCLVINGRVATLDPSLRLVLDRIACILPKGVLAVNVIVVFTNTEVSYQLNFKAAVLEKFWGKQVEESRRFMIDNPFCSLEKATETVDDETLSSLLKSFQNTARVLNNLQAVARDLGEVYTDKFTMLYSMTQEIDKTVAKSLVKYDHKVKLKPRLQKLTMTSQQLCGTKN